MSKPITFMSCRRIKVFRCRTDIHCRSPIQTVEERRAPVDIFFRTLGGIARRACGRRHFVGHGRERFDGHQAHQGKRRRGVCAESARSRDSARCRAIRLPPNSIDEVLNVAEIPAKIIAYQKNLGKIVIPVEPESRREEAATGFARDFYAAARSHRTRFCQLQTPDGFAAHRTADQRPRFAGFAGICRLSAKKHPDETQALLKDLLISVTNFFRDKEAFLYLERDVLPRILTDKTSKDQIRLWVAGCATGEEAIQFGDAFGGTNQPFDECAGGADFCHRY